MKSLRLQRIMKDCSYTCKSSYFPEVCYEFFPHFPHTFPLVPVCPSTVSPIPEIVVSPEEQQSQGNMLTFNNLTNYH